MLTEPCSTPHNRVAESGYRGIPVWFLSNVNSSVHFWNKQHLMASISFKQCVPGRQALQSFVQALWSVVSVCCGERNIWSVCFWVTFSLCIALQAQPVIPISLLPGQRQTHTDIQILTGDSEHLLDTQVSAEKKEVDSRAGYTKW